MGGQAGEYRGDAQGADFDGAHSREKSAAAESAPSPWVNDNTQQAVEGLLFVGSDQDDGWIPVATLRVLANAPSEADVRQIVRTLENGYARNNCPYCITERADTFRMELRESYTRLKESVLGQTRQVGLSRAALEALAIVAYRGTATLQEIENMRGHNSQGVLRLLVRRGLLALERQPGNAPPKYAPTRAFLALFNLSSLADLPRLQDLEKL